MKYNKENLKIMGDCINELEKKGKTQKEIMNLLFRGNQ